MRRNVLLMDVHGVFLSPEDPSEPDQVLIGYRRHKKWVAVMRQVLEEAGALPEQLNEGLLDPRVLWKLRVRLELTTPRTTKGKVVHEKRFHAQVNLRLLREVAPAFMQSLDTARRNLLAHRIKELRREVSHRAGYILEPDMRDLVSGLADEDPPWKLYLTTAGDPRRTVGELCEQKAPLKLFAKIFTTEGVGLPKSHPQFWRKLALLAQSPASHCVILEDNLAMGVNAAKAGMSVVFLDHCGIEEFVSSELGGKVAGIELSRVGESLPRQFVVCAKTVAGVRLCLQRVAAARSS